MRMIFLVASGALGRDAAVHEVDKFSIAHVLVAKGRPRLTEPRKAERLTHSMCPNPPRYVVDSAPSPQEVFFRTQIEIRAHRGCDAFLVGGSQAIKVERPTRTSRLVRELSCD